MKIIQKTSPNFSPGRGGHKPEIIVLHIMQGSLIGTDDWFSKSSSGVSAHYGVGFKGEIHQYVKDEDTAYSQGRVESPSFKLYKPGVNPNKYCLSIEHEGQDLSIIHEGQISATVELIRLLAQKWNIPLDRDHIIGHYQIYSLKPNCPATNKGVIDMIIDRAQEDVQPLPTDKQKIKQAIGILESLL